MCTLKENLESMQKHFKKWSIDDQDTEIFQKKSLTIFDFCHCGNYMDKVIEEAPFLILEINCTSFDIFRLIDYLIFMDLYFKDKIQQVSVTWLSCMAYNLSIEVNNDNSRSPIDFNYSNVYDKMEKILKNKPKEYKSVENDVIYIATTLSESITQRPLLKKLKCDTGYEKMDKVYVGVSLHMLSKMNTYVHTNTSIASWVFYVCMEEKTKEFEKKERKKKIHLDSGEYLKEFTGDSELGVVYLDDTTQPPRELGKVEASLLIDDILETFITQSKTRVENQNFNN